ncbi:unnamed protein product [Nyctereutes procyonoides]|uniref:(raccoon dog) hypothetical protein n=1 Tax=Nyctereutes procyonoides TaxID=34880 RepID=A0A811YMD9_NYCPR|nr:unnamed protein product [Nyctereutes procyonoides]
MLKQVSHPGTIHQLVNLFVIPNQYLSNFCNHVRIHTCMELGNDSVFPISAFAATSWNTATMSNERTLSLRGVNDLPSARPRRRHRLFYPGLLEKVQQWAAWSSHGPTPAPLSLWGTLLPTHEESRLLWGQGGGGGGTLLNFQPPSAYQHGYRNTSSPL